LANGSIDYYERLQKQMGGADSTAEFARVFLVPGADHGLRGAGPSPVGVIEALVRWVEEGKAPDRINAELRNQAGQVTGSRPTMEGVSPLNRLDVKFAFKVGDLSDLLLQVVSAKAYKQNWSSFRGFLAGFSNNLRLC
jgi:hypothetical protein